MKKHHRITRPFRRASKGRAARQLTPAGGEQLVGRIHPLTPSLLNEPAPLVFTTRAWNAIRTTVGTTPAESGGPLGGVRGSGVVEDFYFDTSSAATRVTYYPDFQRLNAHFRDVWNPAGVNLLGVVHSHPAGSIRPSRPDLEYAARILDGIPELDRFVLPIAQSAGDTGRFALHGYAAVREPDRVRLEPIDVFVVPEGATDSAAWPEFDRVLDAYDGYAMERTRIVAIGGGGSASFLEDMARAGVGEIVIVDPDTVDTPNVATQQAYRSDIGRAKVDAIADRLVNISPSLRVWTVQARLNELGDAAVRRLTAGWLPGSIHPSPAASILCAFTDDFETQARVHRLGLHLGVPVVGGIVYAGGRGVEVTFAATGITDACIRCAQSSRYAAYLEHGYRNDVGSAGAPIWATARLNALKLPVVLGLIHTTSRVARADHPATQRFRRVLESVVDRNLVIASLDPDIHSTLGLRMFERSTTDGGGSVLVGSPVETVLWRRPTPDNPGTGAAPCPDCGGTGDLSDSMGRFTSTIPMPRRFGEHRYPAPRPVTPLRRQGAETGEAANAARAD